MMASLKLRDKAQDLSSAVKRQRTEIKGYKTTQEKNAKSQSPIVIRRSLRTRGIAPDAASAKGLDDDLVTSPQKPTSLSQPDNPVRKREQLTIEEACVDGDSSGNRQLVDAIMGMSENVPLSPSKNRGKAVGGCFNFDSMVLRSENVARVVPGRILNVRFFPSENQTMIVVGDKFGNVGFWDVEFKEGDGDGVHLYSPHSAPVSGFSVQPFSLRKMFTSSYDGFIRLMDVEKETFHMVYNSYDAIFSLSQRPNDVKSLYFGEAGGLNIWDERVGSITSSYMLHEKRINSIDFNPENENLMATSSTDGTACIWDLRNICTRRPKNLKMISHEKAVHSAYFSPTGRCLATTSYDNKVRVLSGADFEDIAMISHFNQTNRWISTFRAIWGWNEEYIFIGNMKRAVDVISTVDRTTVSLSSPYMTAIPCRFAAHPYRVGTLAGATAGGQVYIWTAK